MLRSKLPESNNKVLTEIFNRAANEDSVDFATPLPDSKIPQKIRDLVVKYIKSGEKQYAPAEGIIELRKAISDYYFKEYSHKYSPEKEISVTEGSTEALWTVITAIVHEDDEVIIIEPAPSNCVSAIRINGGIPLFVTLKAPGYKTDWNEVIRMVNQRTKMIIMSTPQIPSGKLCTEEDFRNLQKIIVGSKITVLCNESFSNICFEQPFVSIAKFPLMSKQTVLISSLSRGLNATGWKSGFCIAPEDYTAEIRKIHKYICNYGNAAVQHAMAELITSDKEFLESVRDEYKAKRDLLCSLLEGSGYKLIPSQGSWYQMVDISAITKENDISFAQRLAREFGLAVVPMSVYYHDRNRSSIVRICFARPDKVIKEGVKRLLKARKIN